MSLLAIENPVTVRKYFEIRKLYLRTKIRIQSFVKAYIIKTMKTNNIRIIKVKNQNFILLKIYFSSYLKENELKE